MEYPKRVSALGVCILFCALLTLVGPGNATEPPTTSTLAAIESHLAALDKTKADSVSQALDFIMKQRPQLTTDQRDQAYLTFRKFWEEIRRGLDRRVRDLDKKYYSGPGKTLPVSEREKKRVDYEKQMTESFPRENRFGPNGFEIKQSEGDYYVAPQADFFLKHFSGFVFPPILDYLKIERDMEARPPLEDAGIMVPYDELAQHVRALEDYIARYPQSPYAAEANENYKNLLEFYIFGIDNTRIWPYEKPYRLNPELKKSFEKTMREYPGKASTRKVTEFYELLKKYLFTWSPELGREMKTRGYSELAQAQ